MEVLATALNGRPKMVRIGKWTFGVLDGRLVFHSPAGGAAEVSPVRRLTAAEWNRRGLSDADLAAVEAFAASLDQGTVMDVLGSAANGRPKNVCIGRWTVRIHDGRMVLAAAVGGIVEVSPVRRITVEQWDREGFSDEDLAVAKELVRTLGEQSRRLAFRSLQTKVTLGVPVGDRTLGAENALDCWFATGEVLDSLDPADRRLIDWIRDPAAGPAKLLARLHLTLLTHDGEPDAAVAVRAGFGLFGPDDETGLTWGDLRRLDALLRGEPDPGSTPDGSALGDLTYREEGR